MNMSTNISPLGDKVLIEPILPESKTKGGIIIPETVDKERPQQGKIIAVGEGKRSDDGTLIPPAVKKGQTVLFSKYGPTEIKIDGQEYYILSESEILAVIGK